MNLQDSLKGISFYSIGVGVVGADKRPDTDEIYVYLPRDNPAGDGEIIADFEQQIVDTTKADGSTSSLTVLSSNVVPATWFRGSDNKLTSPDVIRGTKVMLYKFVGTNKLYWSTFEYDARALEKVVYGFCANPKLTETKPFNYDDYYVFEIDTMTKKIRFSTSMANNEPCKYIMEINTDKGLVLFNDSEDFNIYLDSMNHDFSIMNQEKSIINMNREDITISTENTINIFSKEKINISTKDLNLDIGNNVDFKVGNNYTLTIGGNYITNVEGNNEVTIGGNNTETVKGKKTSNVSSNTTHTCPETTVNGNLTVIGNIGASGDITCGGAGRSTGGNCEIYGDLTLRGTAKITGDAVIGGISFLNHIHTCPDGTTSPPK